jgi:hypothetical protein
VSEPAATIRVRETAGVGVAGVFSAAVGLVALVVAAAFLPVEDTSRFTYFWAVAFCAFGVLNGLALETTRSVTAAAAAAGPPGAAGTPTPSDAWPVRRVLLTAALGLLGLGAATAAGWRLALPAMSGPLAWWIAGAVLLGVTGFAGHTTLAAALAGRHEWRLYALTVTAESAVRLVLIVAVALAGGGFVALAYATVTAEFAWLGVVALSPAARRALAARTDVTPRLFWRRAGAAMAGQAASALLVVGFPWLLGLTTPAGVALVAAPLTLSVSLTRAPLMVPLNAFQAVAVSHFTARGARLGAAGRILGLITGVGLAGAGLAYLIGPWLLGLLGPGYEIGGATLAGLTLGATALALLTLTGVLCQAATAYRAYVAGWVAAAALAVGLLLLPLEMAPRAVAALVAGPLAGMALHALGLRRGRAGTPPVSAPPSKSN